jgi:hypothetical protein
MIYKLYYKEKKNPKNKQTNKQTKKKEKKERFCLLFNLFHLQVYSEVDEANIFHPNIFRRNYVG